MKCKTEANMWSSRPSDDSCCSATLLCNSLVIVIWIRYQYVSFHQSPQYCMSWFYPYEQCSVRQLSVLHVNRYIIIYRTWKCSSQKQADCVNESMQLSAVTHVTCLLLDVKEFGDFSCSKTADCVELCTFSLYRLMNQTLCTVLTEAHMKRCCRRLPLAADAFFYFLACCLLARV